VTKISGILHEDLITFYCGWRHKFYIRALPSNNQHFYVTDSYMLLNNTHRKYFCLSIATIAARTLQNVTLYVHYQSYWLLSENS